MRPSASDLPPTEPDLRRNAGPKRLRAARSLLPMLAFATFSGAALGCPGGETADETTADVVTVGAIFDLTGPTADVGVDYAAGVRGFADWTNSRGGIGGDGTEGSGVRIDLLFQDYGYQVARAEQLYSQFVGEGAVVFMGWGTGDTEALATRVRDDEIPFSSASLSHRLGDPSEAPYNFLLAASYSDQFRIALDWIARNHGEGAPAVALLHNASPFGLSPARQGGEEFAESRGIELSLHPMPRGAVDFTSELIRARQAGAEYVIFQNTSDPAARAMRNARSLGFEATFICLNWCANRQFVDLAGEAAEGVMGAMPFPPPNADVPGTRVIKGYLAARGDDVEERTNAFTQGWWTFAVFAEAMERVLASGEELVGENIRRALEGITDFDMGGVAMPVTFTPTDHRGAKGLRIYRVEQGAWSPMTDFLEADATPDSEAEAGGEVR